MTKDKFCCYKCKTEVEYLYSKTQFDGNTNQNDYCLECFRIVFNDLTIEDNSTEEPNE